MPGSRNSIGFGLLTPRWQVSGYDSFAHEPYVIGRYYTRRCALWAAWIYLRKLERGGAVDGGPPPDGIRDTVSVSGPRHQHADFSTSGEVRAALRALRAAREAKE
ncbi:MAG: hypothetical protein OEQ29_04090 [Alphaproteobacteria bacterium]|nr:hypothetical protein [Alphaproteobacteria bacterium]